MLWLYVVGLHTGYSKELATTRRQEDMMRPQLRNRPTDTNSSRQQDMRQLKHDVSEKYIHQNFKTRFLNFYLDVPN